jgi:hypothetical protein
MRPGPTFLLAILLLLLAPGVAGAAPGWSDPVRVTDDGTDSGPLLAPLPGGRVAIATAEQSGFPTPTPSEARIVQQADDGSFGAPQRIAGAFPLNGLFGGPSGQLTLLAGGAVFRGPADGPLAPVRGATYLPAVAQLPDGSAVAVYPDANALQAATAPPGGGFGDPVRIGPAGGDVHVAAAGDGTAVAVWTTMPWPRSTPHGGGRTEPGPRPRR